MLNIFFTGVGVAFLISSITVWLFYFVSLCFPKRSNGTTVSDFDIVIEMVNLGI